MNYCCNEDFINVNYCIENYVLKIKLFKNYNANNDKDNKKIYANKKFQFKSLVYNINNESNLFAMLVFFLIK